MNGLCPLCGHTQFADWRFGLFRCQKCEIIVADAVWRQTANEKLNEIAFGDTYEPVRSFWVRMFEAFNNRRTMSRLPRVGGDLLEIGVGSGSFLTYAKDCGYSPLGCDLSAAACARVERGTGIPIHYGSVESVPEGQLFDVVVVNHVLEHVCDPVTFLKAVRSHLKSNGVLHLVVPNVEAWEARLSGWISYEPYHLLYFTPCTLRLAVEQAGFVVRHLRTHESFSGWMLAIFRTVLGKSRLSRVAHESRTRASESIHFVEHTYRLVMVAFGLVTLPLRRFQDMLESGDELVMLVGNRPNG